MTTQPKNFLYSELGWSLVSDCEHTLQLKLTKRLHAHKVTTVLVRNVTKLFENVICPNPDQETLSQVHTLTSPEVNFDLLTLFSRVFDWTHGILNNNCKNVFLSSQLPELLSIPQEGGMDFCKPNRVTQIEQTEC